MMNRTDFIRGAKDGLPIALGYCSVSFTFGMAAVATGLSTGDAVMISLTNLTSAGQFAGLSLIAVQASLFEMAMTTFVINLRYMLMSLSLAQRLDEKMGFLSKAIIAFGNTDEIFAVAVSHKQVRFWYMAGLIVVPVLGWTSGTFLGGTFSTLLPLSLRSAFSVAIYGMFIAILCPAARKIKSVALVCLISVLLSSFLFWSPWFQWLSGGFSIILCTLVAAGLGATFYPVKEAYENE